jgi:hypothetical protein
MPSLSDVLEQLPLSEREMMILDMRFGFSKLHTLAEVAASLLLSRERVRQIQNHAVRGMIGYLIRGHSNVSLLGALYSSSLAPGHRLPRLDDALQVIRAQLAAGGWTDLDDEYVTRLCVLYRSLASREIPLFEPLIYVCLIPPSLHRHPDLRDIARDLGRRERRSRSDASYLKLAAEVLEAAGEPLHWKVIAERAAALGRRRHFKARGMYGTLRSNPEFVRTAPGMYGLASWNLASAESPIK